MRLNIEVAMQCQLTQGDAVLLMVEVAQTGEQVVVSSSLDVERATLRRLGGKVWAHVPGDLFKLTYRAEVDITRSEGRLADLSATPVHDVPDDVMTYLRPSRFCQSDLFTDFAADRFGTRSAGAKIAAIRDWVASELAYTQGSSHGATTAVETFASRQGVCRDFAHMVCTLARAANIPARYVSVYGPDVSPPDFHATAQVWLDGAWHLVDATDMGPTSHMAVIAWGRDAADVAFMETEHWAQPIHQSVKVIRG